ncbi:MAG: PRC-barrel domain-containing protein [Candidatus Hydrothermarchaeales archaeon]
MRVIRIIGIVNVVLGVAFAFVPIKFFNLVRSIFSSSIQPPFGWGAVWTVALLLWIPSISLIISGTALILIEKKLIKVPEYEVYTETGRFLGRVKRVKAPEGTIESFVVDEEEGEEVVLTEDVLAGDDVVLVKEERTKRHSLVEKEVYTEKGEFLGYVKEVILGPDDDVKEIEVGRGEFNTTVNKEDILSMDRVVLVK